MYISEPYVFFYRPRDKITISVVFRTRNVSGITSLSLGLVEARTSCNQVISKSRY